MYSLLGFVATNTRAFHLQPYSAAADNTKSTTTTTELNSTSQKSREKKRKADIHHRTSSTARSAAHNQMVLVYCQEIIGLTFTSKKSSTKPVLDQPSAAALSYLLTWSLSPLLITMEIT